MSVLVLAPHPDDECIGCGGAVVRHAVAGARVTVAFLTSGELGLKTLPAQEARRVREAEAEAAAAVLGVAEVAFLRGPDWGLAEAVPELAGALRPLLARERPERVYLPHGGDAHPDHRAAGAILAGALDGATPELFAYEVWTPLAAWDEIEDVSDVMPRKLEAIRCHRSQLAQLRYDDAARGLAAYRGALAGNCEYAEAFARPHP